MIGGILFFVACAKLAEKTSNPLLGSICYIVLQAIFGIDWIAQTKTSSVVLYMLVSFGVAWAALTVTNRFQDSISGWVLSTLGGICALGAVSLLFVI